MNKVKSEVLVSQIENFRNTSEVEGINLNNIKQNSEIKIESGPKIPEAGKFVKMSHSKKFDSAKGSK